MVSLEEELPQQEPYQTSESQDFKEESIYWETEEVNPNMVIYDLENNRTIIPTSDEEITTLPPGEKIISRNVSSRHRNIR
jgi:hypothetical protein